MIPFNRPPVVGTEIAYIQEALANSKLSGDGSFTKRCHTWLEERLACSKALLTTSCTHALEISALLCNIGPGDEVIMSSYTFVSTANAFVLRGAKVVFVDIRPDTLNIDENLIEEAITEKTKAIVVVHYAGVACEMDSIVALARRYGLFLIEDAAQALMSTYKGKALGTFGDFGCFSFHDTKNISCGEGGALIINNPLYVEKAEIIREKGTDRSRFFRGQVDKYTWVEPGSSYLPSELNAAYLLAQLEAAELITANRLATWDFFKNNLDSIARASLIDLPVVPDDCQHNGHLFYFHCSSLETRTAVLRHLSKSGVGAVFHYVPLHTSPAGLNYSRFHGDDRYTTTLSERLVRLPLFFGMQDNERSMIASSVHSFFS